MTTFSSPHHPTLSNQPVRDDNIDLLKGVLVVLMVCFHVASMTIRSRPELLGIMGHLEFLHLAFLTVSGAIVGVHYLPKLASIGRKSAGQRLRVRGFRLLVVFLVLNVIAYTLGINSFVELRGILDNKFLVLNRLILSPDGDLYATEVLYHISIFLLVCSVFISRYSRGISLIFFVLLLWFGRWATVCVSSAAGVLGIVIGECYSKAGAHELLARVRGLKATILMLGCICLIYALGMSSARQFDGYPGVLVGRSMCSVVLLFVLVSIYYRSSRGGIFHNAIGLLGRYSLFGYIWQMAVIRLVAKGLIGRLDLGPRPYYVANVVLTTAVVCITIHWLDVLRGRMPLINRVYRGVFD